MAKPTSNKHGNKARSAVRGKAAADRGAARNNNDGGGTKLKPVLAASRSEQMAAAVAATPPVEKAAEADVHSIELMDPRRKSAVHPPEASVAGGGRYVYGVIQAPGMKESVNFGRTGIGGFGEQVYTVHHGDIAAVVSKTNVFIFDPTRENALAHEHVIELVMKTHTIIPMSFGTVFRTDDDIREVLKSIYASLKDVLEQMAGKVEFGLKVTWDRDRIIEELKRDDEEIRRFHQELTKKHLQSTYFARMQLGRMIEKTMVERSADFVREIYDGLRSVCVASRDNKPIGDKMIMNAAFLIQRERETAFDAAVNKIAKKFGDRLNFKYTGPWPPYNFVNIRLKLERGTSP
ncbi:MAG TPA: GvpL/GvpF family gas vesicle protein [Terriglobales bacterium]|nr:GvpL/GvpF family gas vesicle protein [Terriglobales bacterium]